MLLSELAKEVNATFTGKDVEIKNINTLADAKEGDISFLFNKKYAPMLATTKASSVILPDWAPEVPISTLRDKNPHLLYSKVMRVFKKMHSIKVEISPKAHIAQSAKIGEGVTVAPFAYIGENVEIGDGAKIYPNTTILDNAIIGAGSIIYSNVSIREDVVIGKNVILHSGVVVGADGFGFAKNEKGEHEKIPHVGSVIIEDNVEIGANSAIDRASFGNTVVGKGTKIDNMVHLAHSVEVGENVLLVAQVGVAGSSKIGDSSILAGKVAVTGHVKIGKNVMAAPLSGINDDIEDGSVVGGAPAIDAKTWKRAAVSYKKLPDMVKDIRAIKRHLELDETK